MSRIYSVNEPSTDAIAPAEDEHCTGLVSSVFEFTPSPFDTRCEKASQLNSSMLVAHYEEWYSGVCLTLVFGARGRTRAVRTETPDRLLYRVSAQSSLNPWDWIASGIENMSYSDAIGYGIVQDEVYSLCTCHL